MVFVIAGGALFLNAFSIPFERANDIQYFKKSLNKNARSAGH
jgi:hypothetical protein